MSRFEKKEEKVQNNFKKNGTLFYSDSIQYSKPELIEIMKQGYIEMGEINLRLAIDSESELVDINKYETWLFGE